MNHDSPHTGYLRHGAVLCRTTSLWLATLCLTGLCSCITLSRPNRLLSERASFWPPTRQAIRSSTGDLIVRASDGPSDPFLQSSQQAHASEVATAPSSEIPASTPTGRASAVVFHASEPRVQLGQVSRNAPLAHQEPTADPDTLAQQFPDEYLMDGGDREQPIHYGTFNRLGVDTEDTIAEYVDPTGDRHVKPTNRVAIYAPRFGAVQTVNRASWDTAVDHLASTLELTRGAGLIDRRKSTQHAKTVSPGDVRVRSRASGIEMQRRTVNVSGALVLADHTKRLNICEQNSFLRTGQFGQTAEGWLAYGIAAAFDWSRSQYPVITATTDSLHDVTSSFRLQELVGLDMEHKTDGQLQIVKLADKKVAKPDDVITFTIRFENLGDRELHHIRIVDNLTPRLEYIEDSANSDRPGNIVTDDNEEGSLVLRFEMDGPLSGHTSGFVSFQARVR